MKDKEFSETVTRDFDNGVKTEKTVGQDGDSKWESLKVSSEKEDVAPIYKEEMDENGRRRGYSDWGDREENLDDEDKAWLEVLWRSPADTEERYHRAIQAYKKEKGLTGESSWEEIKAVFGLDDNEQCVEYPTEEGLQYLKKSVDRTPRKKEEEVVEEEEEEYGEDR